MDNVLVQYASALQKVYWYAYLQVLWVLFTLAGLIIFGIFPATRALMTVMNQQTDTSAVDIFHTFRQAYQEVFFAINKASILWTIMLILMSVNLLILPETQQILRLLALGMICFLLLCIVHFIYFFHYREPTFVQIKQSFAHACLHPRKNVGYACIFLLLGIAILFIPGITCFFGVSVTAKLITHIATN